MILIPERRVSLKMAVFEVILSADIVSNSQAVPGSPEQYHLSSRSSSIPSKQRCAVEDYCCTGYLL